MRDIVLGRKNLGRHNRREFVHNRRARKAKSKQKKNETTSRATSEKKQY
jgi:hypothetical protein